MSEQLRRSPLHQQHVAAGAHFGAFSGWEMPLRYAGTLTEHAAVRHDCGIFDVSHLGVVDVIGADALAVVGRTFTNDVTVLDDGDAQYSLCLAADGTVIDDLIVYRIRADWLRAIPNAANTAAVQAALRTDLAAQDARVVQHSTAAVLALQGPASAAAVTHILDALEIASPVMDLNYMSFQLFQHAGTDVMLSRTGYTGEYGFEIVTNQTVGQIVWDTAVQHGVTPAGLAARDTLRLEMGYPLHGHELSSTTTPLRRNVAFAVRSTNQTFVGAEALNVTAKPDQVMRGVKATGRRPFRDGMTVYAGDTPVGTLTSGGISPTLGVAIGLGMLNDTVPVDAAVTVDVRGSREPAIVTRAPFVSSDPRRIPQP